MFVHTVIMVIEPHMKQGRQHKLISTIFLATSVTKKLDHNRVSFLRIKLLPKRDTGSLGISQNTKPALLVEVPKFQPFVKQVLRNAEALTELLYGAKVCKVLSQKTQNKEQTETGVRDDGIGKNSMSVFTAVTEDSENAEA